jgi:lysophospholipase L1-like esterase
MRLALVAAAVAVALAGASARAAPQHLRVLFVGNSLTATNDLPATVAAYARAVGRVHLDVASYAPGGYALEDHWADGAARGLLAQGGWDAVVLQQGPSSLPASRANLIEWTRRWAVEARAHGARPALLTVWPERARLPVFPAVIANHRAAAAAARAASFPAGAAWWDLLRRPAPPPLYGTDGFHPSPLGTYLTAAVVYTGLTGELPERLPRAVGGLRISAATAMRLRAAVARAYAAR